MNDGLKSHNSSHHPDTADGDIRAALADLPWYAQPGIVGPYPLPPSNNAFVVMFWMLRCLAWGILNAFKKLVAASRKHPWVAVLGLISAIAMCPVCKYATGTILLGFICWGVASEPYASSSSSGEERSG